MHTNACGQLRYERKLEDAENKDIVNAKDTAKYEERTEKVRMEYRTHFQELYRAVMFAANMGSLVRDHFGEDREEVAGGNEVREDERGSGMSGGEREGEGGDGAGKGRRRERQAIREESDKSIRPQASQRGTRGALISRLP